MTARQGLGGIRTVAAIASLFGVVTIWEGGSVLFVDGTARAAAGAYVPFVVAFNFAAGFAYVVAGFGLWRGRRWAALLAAGLAGSTTIVFLALGLHVWAGGAWEMRTVGALTIRAAFWTVAATLACRHERRSGPR